MRFDSCKGRGANASTAHVIAPKRPGWQSQRHNLAADSQLRMNVYNGLLVRMPSAAHDWAAWRINYISRLEALHTALPQWFILQGDDRPFFYKAKQEKVKVICGDTRDFLEPDQFAKLRSSTPFSE